MSFADCVEAAVQAGRMSRDQAEELYQRQQDAADRFALDMQHSPESANRLANELGVERAKQNVRLQKYQAALQAIRNAENTNKILGYARGPTRGVRTLLARDSKNIAAWGNVETRAKGIRGQAHALMAQSLSVLRSRWFGLSRNKKILKQSVRELFGESTGNADARTFARSFAEAAEILRQRFNRAGGAIAKREGWGLPQSHDATLVGRASVGEWVDFVQQRLDLEKMIDVETGQPFTPDSLEVVLQGVYETIRTNGLADMVPGAAGGKKLANRRQEARFLAFKDADSWLEYQERFGSSNLYGTMMDHINDMSRDVALLETLGPNPQAAFRYLQDTAKRLEDKPAARTANQAVFNIVNGTGDANRSNMQAHVFGAIRNWNIASTLGGAALSAIADQAFIRSTAKWVGLRPIKTFQRFIETLNPANEADRILATRIGITALSWSEAYSNVGRFAELGGSGADTLGKVSDFGARAAEVVLRSTGLNAITDAGRRGFAMEFAANLAESFSKGLDELDGAWGQTLRSRGMTPEDWDLIRQTPTAEHKGARFFVVDELLRREDLPISKRQQLAARIQDVLNEEILYAVPEPDALARVITTGGGLPRGNLMGEVARTLALFKSFPIAVLSLHAQRAIAARQLRGGYTAAAYAAGLIVGTTIFGYVAMSLKQIARGKDPRPIDDPRTWGAAFTQGGGAGIFGDFLFNDVNRFGSGPMMTLAGPVASQTDMAVKLTLGNFQEAIAGEDTNAAAEAVNFASRYTPGASIWYMRLILEREIFDQMALMTDPVGAQRRFRSSERRAMDQGTDYWWSPGDTAPSRAPDLEVLDQ